MLELWNFRGGKFRGGTFRTTKSEKPRVTVSYAAAAAFGAGF